MKGFTTFICSFKVQHLNLHITIHGYGDATLHALITDYHSLEMSTVYCQEYGVLHYKTTFFFDFLLLPGVTTILLRTVCTNKSNKFCYSSIAHVFSHIYVLFFPKNTY